MSSPTTTDDLPESTREDISWRVRSGFYTADEIIETMIETITEELNVSPAEAKRQIRQHTAAEWVAQLERQQSWPPEPTISDKLTRAFERLERRHRIIARMNFTCCQTCGVSEIRCDAEDDDADGYVFFHEQDTEAVTGGGGLYLAFGSFTKSKRRDELVGHTIVKSLRRAGLGVTWDGSAAARIVVECDEWRRRLGEEEVEDVQDDDFDSECVSEDEDEELELESRPALDVDGEEIS